MTYSTGQSWAVLTLIMAAGALTRQFFVLWHGGTRAWALPACGAALVAAAMAWLAPPAAPATAGSATVRLADIEPIIAARCAPCHAAHPKLMAAAPAGLVLETPRDIMANGARIAMQAVQLKAMPLGNLTHITAEERAKIGAWFARGMKE
jgi:uncharacterized membrane protein